MVKKAVFVHREQGKKKRKGVHAKTKSSKMKNSVNYLKKYKGQGR